MDNKPFKFYYLEGGRFFHLTGILLSCFILLAVLQLSAQHLSYKNYNVEDGLSSSIVHDMLQDQRGYIWFATERGVSVFDGHSFENITTKNGLAENDIRSIHEDSQGRIWFLTLTGGISYYLDNKVYNPGNDPLLAEVNAGSMFTSFLEDDKGNIWLAAISNGVYKLGPDKVERFDTSAGLHSNNVFYLWPGENGGVSGFLIGNEMFTITDDSISHRSTEHDFITGFTRLADGGVLYPSYDKLIRLTNDTTEEMNLPGFDVIFKKGITWLEETADNDLWFGTIFDGVYYYGKDSSITVDVFDHFMAGKRVSSILKDGEGNLWFTTIGEGVYFLASSAREILAFSVIDGLSDNRAYAIS